MRHASQLSSALEAATEGGPPRADVSLADLLPNKNVLEIAGDLLGVHAAFVLLPELYPEGWSRYPELASGVWVSRNDRRFQAGPRRGDVVALFKDVSGEPDGFAAAELIVDLIGSMPEAEREQYGPAPEPRPALPSSKVETSQKGEVPIAPHDDSLPGLPEIEDVADLVAKELPAPLELVSGILHQGSKMILGSSSKAGKTWTLIDLGLSVAYGRKWLGFATTQGPVLYVNLEIQEAFFADRIRTVAGVKAITLERG